jgi:PAS domain S-box-containing protein/diguanylate cyclase (GGDEF)-like protein
MSDLLPPQAVEHIDLLEELRDLTLLYVEDDETILTSLQRPLSRRFKHLYIGRNGEEGLNLCLSQHPDIVITDIRMPLLDGLEMSREIRKQLPQVPILITSAFDDTEYLLKAISLGVSQYVLKPVDLKKLLSALESCVRELALEKRIQRKNAELRRNLKMLTEYQRAVEQSTTVCKTDPRRIITEVNEALCKLSGYRPEQLIGQHCKILLHPDAMQQTCEIQENLAQHQTYKGIVKNRRQDGKVFYTNLTVVPILDERNDIEEYLEFREDITQLIEKLYTDPLTGSPNRAALQRDLERAKTPALIVLNIDNFKEVNNFYGNEIGDFLLRKIVEVLGAHLRQEHLNARLYKLSGDEFAVLLENPPTETTPRELVHELHEYLEACVFHYEENEISLTFTSGFSLLGQDPLMEADIALRQAKKTHQDIVCFEDLRDIKKQFESNIRWSKKLKQALQDGRIQPWFQPIVESGNGRIVKYECLVRLIEEDGQVVTPDHFLDIARKSQLYHQLTRIMIERCCEVFKDMPYHFSLNLTASDILNRETLSFLEQALIRYGVGDKLTIELLEWEDVQEYGELVDVLQYMKTLGCQIAIDDFGSGYSNFKHLMKIQADFIKIDGSIIKWVAEDAHSFTITQMIAEFARKLGIQTVAEHVHSAEVMEKIKELRIDFAQGFYYGKAVPGIA